MSEERESIRDIVPRGGKTQIRSVSTEKRSDRNENERFEKHQSKHRFYDVIRSKSLPTDRRSNNYVQNEEWKSLPQEKRISRDEVSLTTPVLRSISSAEVTFSPEKDVDLAESSVEIQSNDVIDHNFRIEHGNPGKSGVRTGHRCRNTRSRKQKFKRRKERSRRISHKTHTTRDKHQFPVGSKIQDRQPVHRTKNDGNNNAIDTDMPLDSKNGERNPARLSILARLRKSLLCSSDNDVIKTTSNQNGVWTATNEFSSNFRNSSTGDSGEKNGRIGRRGFSLDFVDRESWEQESLLREYWALHNIWKKGEATAKSVHQSNETQERLSVSSLLAEDHQFCAAVNHETDETKSQKKPEEVERANEATSLRLDGNKDEDVDLSRTLSDDRKNVSIDIGDQNNPNGHQELLSGKDVCLDAQRSRYDDGDVPMSRGVLTAGELQQDRLLNGELRQKAFHEGNREIKKPVAFIVDLSSDIDTQQCGDLSSIKHDGGVFDKKGYKCCSTQQKPYAEHCAMEIKPSKPIAFFIDMTRDGVEDDTETKRGGNEAGAREAGKNPDPENTDRYGQCTGQPQKDDEYNQVESVDELASREQLTAVSEESRLTKKPFEFTIDMINDEDGKAVMYAPREDNTQIVSSGLDTKQFSKIAVAFVIDMSDEEYSVKPYRKDMPNKTKKRRQNDSVIHGLSMGYKRLPLASNTKRYETTWRTGNSRSQTARQEGPFEMNDGFIHNQLGQTPKKLTFKMILESRLRLKAMYEKQKITPRKDTGTKKRAPVKANYDSIKSKIKTRFPQTGKTVGNHGGVSHCEDSLLEISYCHDEGRLPVIYEDVVCDIRREFPRDNITVINDQVSIGQGKVALVKHKYDGVKSKIRTRFPEKPKRAPIGSQNTKAVPNEFPDKQAAISDDDANSNDPKRGKTPIKRKYDGVKSKIKTRFPGKPIEKISEVATKAPNGKSNPVKQKYGEVKSKIKTRFPDGNKSGQTTKELNIARKSAPSDIINTVDTNCPTACNNEQDPIRQSETSMIKGIGQTKTRRNVGYPKFAEFRKASNVPIFDLPVTYQRNRAKSASKLPLSKNMQLQKERFRLNPNRRKQRAIPAAQRPRGNGNDKNTSTEEQSKTDLSLTYDTLTINYQDQENQSGMSNEKARMTPRMSIHPVTVQNYSQESDKDNTSTCSIDRQNSATPSQLKSPLEVKRSKSVGNQSVEKTHSKEACIQNCLGPENVSPSISFRDRNGTPVRISPGFIRAELPPILGTPTSPGPDTPKPTGQHMSTINDGSLAVLQGAGQDQRIMPSTRHSPILPYGSCVDNKDIYEASQSPRMNQKKLPPILGPSSTNQHNRSPRTRSSCPLTRQGKLDRSSLFDEVQSSISPGMNQKKLTPIKRSPTLSRDFSDISVQGNAEITAMRRIPGLNVPKLPPIRCTSTPPVTTEKCSILNERDNDEKHFASHSTNLDDWEVLPVMCTPTPPCLNTPLLTRQSSTLDNGHRIENKSDVGNSLELDLLKLPLIVQIPSPPSVNVHTPIEPSSLGSIDQNIDEKSAMGTRPGLNLQKLPPIRRTPTSPCADSPSLSRQYPQSEKRRDVDGDKVLPIRDTTLPIWNIPPPVQDTHTPIRNTDSPVRDILPPIRDVLSPIRETPPPIRNSLSPIRSTPPSSSGLSHDF